VKLDGRRVVVVGGGEIATASGCVCCKPARTSWSYAALNAQVTRSSAATTRCVCVRRNFPRKHLQDAFSVSPENSYVPSVTKAPSLSRKRSARDPLQFSALDSRLPYSLRRLVVRAARAGKFALSKTERATVPWRSRFAAKELGAVRRSIRKNWIEWLGARTGCITPLSVVAGQQRSVHNPRAGKGSGRFCWHEANRSHKAGVE